MVAFPTVLLFSFLTQLIPNASAGHLDTPYRTKAPAHSGAGPQFTDEDAEAVRRLRDLPKATRSLADQAWNAIPLTRNLKVFSDDFAKGNRRTNGCPCLCCLVQSLRTCTRPVQTQRPRGSCPENTE